MILSVCPNPSVDTYAWIDQFKLDQVNKFTKLVEYPGGKGTHVAMALRELDATTALMGCWAGASGQWIREQCHLLNIETTGITIPGNNRKCYTFRSERDHLNNTELLEPGPALTKKDYQQLLDEYAKQIKDYDLICVSGSWPSGAPDTAYAEAIQLAREADREIIIDCSGKQLQNSLKLPFFGIHMNEQEALSLAKTESIEECITKLNKTIKLVAITKGKDGLWLGYNDTIIHANVTINNVLSPVGSGDCLTAGLAYAVSRSMAIEDIAKYGVACGAANCLYEDIGQLKGGDVKALLPKVSLNVMTYDS